jgi:uncharacterized iron-regulated protein
MWTKACIVAASLSVTLAAQSYVPHRVFNTATGGFGDFESMAAALAKADVVFVGEQHDDPNTHRLELAILESLARRGRRAVVSLEMFERDVQEPLEHFLMGHMDEAEFLKASRPWPRYATDYKPLVDFAMSKEWPVVAANVPRPIASEVAKGGPDLLKSKSEPDRRLFAADLKCPAEGEYFRRFGDAMGSHPAADASGDEARRTLERYYFSQCLKDETMAESIAQTFTATRAAGAPVIVHYNGAFHSDYRLGTAERTIRRLPNARVVVISVKPVADLDNITVTKEDEKLGDFLLYTLRPKAEGKSSQKAEGRRQK